MSSAHPHRRGEHLKVTARTSGCPGSSPQARGTPAGRRAGCGCGRLIPTGAGNTRRQQAPDRQAAAHPHRRGEHAPLDANGGISGGSSPQARGTLLPGAGLQRRQRLIPTGAGNTRRGSSIMPTWPAHPHRRGEHGPNQVLFQLLGGSSPQARGTRAAAAARDLPRRLIPTGAGNTSLRATLFRFSTAPSPQARGTQTACSRAVMLGRLIPTGAGNTMRTGASDQMTTAHPHRRGEHVSKVERDCGSIGSSPQARGTPRTG